ncbi:hypothetical protein O988_01355 [Pseudogymnoascus sp. VKM F-3808]|nr:hypothetical protein O988_01355 [Pseudogymnoascus sp. VKM F-3808]
MEKNVIRSLNSKSHIVVECINCPSVVLCTALDKLEDDPKKATKKQYLVTICLQCETSGWDKVAKGPEVKAIMKEEILGWSTYKAINSYLGGDLKLPEAIMPAGAILTVPCETIRNKLGDKFVAQTFDSENTSQQSLRPYLQCGFF